MKNNKEINYALPIGLVIIVASIVVIYDLDDTEAMIAYAIGLIVLIALHYASKKE